MEDSDTDIFVRRESSESRDEAAAILAKAFGELERIRDGLNAHAETQKGSSLSGDDLKSPRFIPSVTFHHSIAGALNCLEELRELMVVENKSEIEITSRPYGQIALVRQALDMAALGSYLLSPPARTERIRRVFLLEKENARLSYNTLANFGETPSKPLADRLEYLQAAAQEAGQTDLDLLRKEIKLPTTTSMLEAVQREPWTEPRSYLGTWQLASGFAHGMSWAMSQVAELEEVAPSSRTASSTYHVTIGFTLLCTLVGNAVLLVRDLVGLYVSRAQKHH